MKFSLVVLLGLCAFVSSYEIFENIPDVDYVTLEPVIVPRLGDNSFPAVINQYFAKISKEFNSVVDKFRDISGTVRKEVQSNNDKQIVQINENAAVVTQSIEELAIKGPTYAACAQQHLSEILNITSSVAVGIKECVSDIASPLKVLAEDIIKASTSLTGDSLRLKDIALECYNKGSKFAAATCALGHLMQFKGLATKVLSAAKESLVTFKAHGQELLDSVKKCNEQYVQTTLNKFQNIKKVMIECANQ